MSFYGAKGTSNYTVHKRRLQANGEFRFGGATALLAYSVPGAEEVSVQLSQTQSGNVHVVQTGASDCVSVAIRGNSNSVNILSPQFVDVVNEYKLAPGTQAIVLENSLTTADGQVHNSDSGIPIVVADESEVVLTGTAKILTLAVSVE